MRDSRLLGASNSSCLLVPKRHVRRALTRDRSRYQCPAATRNTKDFDHTGLTLINLGWQAKPDTATSIAPEGKQVSAESNQPQKAQITFGKFDNVDMRVARVVSAPLADGTKAPCRVITLDLGHLGQRISVGQYALMAKDDLVGAHVIVCVNLGSRELGSYVSEALVLGAPHPDSPTDQAQATPLFVSTQTNPGDRIF